MDEKLGGRPGARHPRRVEVDVQPADQVDDVLRQPGVAAGDAAVSEAVRGLAEESGRQAGKPRAPGDRDRGQPRDLPGVLAQRRLRNPQDEQRYDVRVTLDQRSAMRTDGRRKSYRFQVQGPHAMDVIARALGTQPPELKFFNLTTAQIGSVTVRALRHGMAGQPGWELFGPWDDYKPVHAAIVAAGEEFGLRLVGGRAYSSNALESGWIPSPLPAVYSGDELRAYREWLPATGYEGSASIGGSFVSARIEDYYFTPWDLGYGHLVKFDHEFIGRDALERMAGDEHRHKVTLALNDDDVADTIATMFDKADRAKFIDWPSAVYSMHPFDRVTVNGDTVGVSTWIGYTFNEGKMLTLAVLDAEHAEPGTEVTFVWGEENGGTSKPTVEPHVQRELRAVVAPVPYVEVVRTGYAPDSWRSART